MQPARIALCHLAIDRHIARRRRRVQALAIVAAGVLLLVALAAAWAVRS